MASSGERATPMATFTIERLRRAPERYIQQHDPRRASARTCPHPAANRRSPPAAAPPSALDGLLGLRLAALSRWYETAPVPPSGTAALRQRRRAARGGRRSRARCSRRCRPSSGAFGRDAAPPNAARTLDLDIVAIGRHSCAPRPTRCCRIRACTSAPSSSRRCWTWRPTGTILASAAARAPAGRAARPRACSHLRDGALGLG